MREVAMIGIGHWELLIVAAVIFLLFGHRFPSVMGSVGEGLRVFTRALSGQDEPSASDSSIHH
jgi:TatA/E family protein of Tat protein translocase